MGRNAHVLASAYAPWLTDMEWFAKKIAGDPGDRDGRFGYCLAF